MEVAFYGPLGARTVPRSQRHFATKTVLPEYAERIGAPSSMILPLSAVP